MSDPETIGRYNCPNCGCWFTEPNEETPETAAEIARLTAEVERLKDGHCKDCCCARSWEALGITEYTGRSIPEEIERLQAVVEAALAWDAEMFNPQSWHQTEKDLHDAVRALDGEPCPTCDGSGEDRSTIHAKAYYGKFDPCPTCHGHGTIPIVVVGEGTVKSETCQTCDGSGEKVVEGYDQRYADTVEAEYPCPTCHGGGALDGEPCPRCGGEGKWYREPGRKGDSEPCPTCHGDGTAYPGVLLSSDDPANAPCPTCRGEAKLEQYNCPTCHGTGRKP